jgi:putative Ca2+/H+ antiporter (TMEM165/GDT1 family)
VTGFLFAFLAVLVASLGARDTVLLAQLTRAQGPRAGVLASALVAAAATSAFAGWAALALLPQMLPPARVVFAALALVVAGAEMLVLSPSRGPEEPTRSLFAVLLVLAAQQVTDASRLLILALGVGTASPVEAALGGGAASVAMVAAAWLAPDLPTLPWLRLARRIAGGLLLVAGVLLALPRVIV